MKKSVIDMTVDEFRDELQRIRELTMDFSDSTVGTRQDRRYGDNMKRGNFQGNAQTQMRTDSLGRPRGSKYDG